jgi:subtilisin
MLTDSALLLLRITAGIVVAGYGSQKLFGWFGEEGPDGRFARGSLRLVLGAAQALSGIFLAFGVWPVGSALLLAMTVLTLGHPHWRRALWGQVGAQFPLVLAVVAAIVAVQGPGDISFTRAAEHISLASARQDGSIRVIAQLDAAFRPEPRLSPADREDQREGIADQRAGVLQELVGTGSDVVRSYNTVPFVALEVTGEGLQELIRSEHVVRVAEDVAMAPSLLESVPFVEAPALWRAGYDGTGQTVAVLDTGIDAAHPFLLGKVIEEACYSSTGDCPNGTTSQTGPGAGAACLFSIECSHGTHVAGTVAGAAGPLSGVAPGARLMSVQVFSERNGSIACGAVGPCARALTSDMLKALERVYSLRSMYSFAAVNVSVGEGSYGSPCDSNMLKPAIDNLRAAGIATIASSGNEGYTNAMTAPACVSSAVSVGATSDTGAGGVAGFSNSAGFLSLLAPGSSVLSSVPGGRFEAWGGTSMAAPHVAGAWALLKQKDPAASVNDVLGRLRASGHPVQDPRNGVTTPRIRVYQAAFGTLPPVPTDLTVSLSLRRRLVAKGSVNGFEDCLGPVRVQIQRSAGGWRAVKSLTAHNSGRYKVRIPSKKGTYRAVATADGGSGVVCTANSPRRRVAATRRSGL